jgi:hypothetical protein
VTGVQTCALPIWSITHYDLEKILEAIPTTHTIDEIEPIYRSLKGKHGKIIVQSLDNSLEIKDE